MSEDDLQQQDEALIGRIRAFWHDRAAALGAEPRATLPSSTEAVLSQMVASHNRMADLPR